MRLGVLPLIFVLVGLLASCGKDSPLVDDPDNTGNNELPEPNHPIPGELGELFLYGSNMGTYPGWSDQQLAELLIGNPDRGIAGAGVNSLRPAMYDHFVERWGYGVRVSAFETYRQLGGKDHTIFLSGPDAAHREQTMHCDGVQSQTFANLYEPIWLAPGEVNPNNYYANYVYNVVKTYSPYVKYWEVWNEPDYTNNWQASQSWDQADPNPCDLTNFAAPIQSYVRMLRITHEIVRHLDDDALVCVGGLGYPRFLDAILRNTDNPNGGGVSAEYPKKGGDWFDCLSYHVYPMYYVGNNPHSDAAAAAVVNHKDAFQAVLDKYGYNGTTSPKKPFIITESNIPRRPIGGYLGGDEVQRNFLVKAAVLAQKAGISGLYVYGLSESRPIGQASNPYEAMGFYEHVTGTPYNASITPGGVAWRTVSQQLGARRYDPAATASLQLPAHIDGGAFYSEIDKDYVYVLWAKTSGSSEDATAEYRFPESFNIAKATGFDWENKPSSISGTVSLSGSPLFVIP